MRVAIGLLVTAVCLGLGQKSAAGAALDTTYCWPTVIAREASSDRPLVATVNVFRVERVEADSVKWVAHERGCQTYSDGTIEIPALGTGTYLVKVSGTTEERPLPGWKPPPARPTEVTVGFDTWRRPTQVRFSESWAEWEITRGNCADSIVVRLQPGEWEVVPVDSGHWLREQLWRLPPGYRWMHSKRTRSTPQKP